MFTIFSNTMQAWMNAYNGDDADKLIPLYSENAEYISSHVNGPVAKDR